MTSSQPAPVAMVTGATGAIGRAIARQLAAKNFEVILACRNEAKAGQAVEEMIRATGNRSVRYELVDVARLASIQALAGRWAGRWTCWSITLRSRPSPARKRRKGLNCSLRRMSWAISG